MMNDLLDGPGRLVLGTVLTGHEDDLAGAPLVHPVAGLGEIGRHERLPDGRYLILVVGLERVVIHEVESDRPYRKVRAEPLREYPPSPEVEQELRPELLEALRSRLTVDPDLMESLAVHQLTDLLLLQLRLPQDAMLALYSEPDVASRARGCLEQHEVAPNRKSDQRLDLRNLEDPGSLGEDPPGPGI
jgi:hypothetical protein